MGDDDLSELIGSVVSVLFTVGERRSVTRGILVGITPKSLKLRSIASKTKGRETLLARSFVVAVQAAEQGV